MAALIGGANHSTVSVDKSGMTIRLPSQVFGKGWLLLLARLLSVIVKHMSFPFPQRIMTSRESSDQAPNWIRAEIDGLRMSCLWGYVLAKQKVRSSMGYTIEYG